MDVDAFGKPAFSLSLKGRKTGFAVSRNGGPVDVGFAQLAKAIPQQFILGALAGGIVVNDALCFVAGHLHNLTVAGDVGNFQIEGHAALLCPLQVARTAKLQVGLSSKPSLVSHMMSMRLRVSAESW